MKSYLISQLTFKSSNADLETFRKAYPHDWLLWEPGSWKPPGSTTLVGQGLSSTPANGNPTGQALALVLEPKRDGGQLTLGRGPECDIFINDGTLSQLHLVLMQAAGGGWTVRDAGSRNGSTLDGVKLLPGAPLPLKAGGKLVAAGVTFTYYDPAGMLQRLQVAQGLV
ncbi:MAG: FHA domain-containing protein [Archangiaceae bacterium]|nr:FHA domain-containing protein [Archangiaceae bacterium]